MDLHIAICDDNSQWIELEKKYIYTLGKLGFTYKAFYSGEELLQVYQEQGCIFDAIFLDMEMDGLSGIETANAIRRFDKHTIIVFVTSYTKYMQESFICSPFCFLVKPINFQEFKDVMLKITETIAEDRHAITFYEGRKIIRLLYEDIMFLQSIDHHILIKTRTRMYKPYTTFVKLKEKLSSNIFLPTHKSYIVNMNYIEEISEGNVWLRGYNEPLPLSNTYKADLSRKLMLLEERKHLS